MYKCKYCFIEVEKKQQLGGHYRQYHPDHIGFHKSILRDGSWRPGYAASREVELLRREKISNSMKKNPNGGGRRQGSGRGKKGWYESLIAGRVFLDSSYELAYAKYLDENQIKWVRNSKRFCYLDENNKERYYIPDFYLIDTEIYIEIKGYETIRDKHKWESFPHTLTILKREDLINLNIKLEG